MSESLPEFLLARIAEDEAAAREIPTGSWEDACSTTRRYDHVFRWSPARVLAECAAKRRLIDWCAPVSGSERVPTDRPGVYDRREVRYANEDGEDVMRYLAMPYVDHQDYREEWKP